MHHSKILHITLIEIQYAACTGKAPAKPMNNEIYNTFDASREQGTGEWKTFNAVTHDRTSIFHAAMNYRPKPRKETAIRFGASRLFVLRHA